jgi:uncharacterized BrkB/YihY/UPF0761 family membrane protein
MTAYKRPNNDTLWASVERDKRIDRILRRVTVAAWAVVAIVVLLFAVWTAVAVSYWVRMAAAEIVPWSVALGTAMPFLIVLVALSVLIATLGTIAIFLRLRTVSLTEVRLRLAALEEMLTSRGDSVPGDSA